MWLSDAPSVTLHLASNQDLDNLLEGETVEIKCAVDASPQTHTVQWTFEVRTATQPLSLCT